MDFEFKHKNNFLFSQDLILKDYVIIKSFSVVVTCMLTRFRHVLYILSWVMDIIFRRTLHKVLKKNQQNNANMAIHYKNMRLEHRQKTDC